MATEELPVVDLDQSEDIVVQSIRSACESFGFFYLLGHGIPIEQFDSVLATSKSFFEQEDSIKAKVGPGSPGPDFRGYSPWRAIALDPNWQTGGDTREQFSIGREVSIDSKDAKQWPSILGPNKWPESTASFDGESFRRTMTSYFDTIEALGLRMLPLLALALGARPDELVSLFSPPLVTMNLNHYAREASDPAAGRLGCGAHTDYGGLTFLLTDEVPGLQVCRGRDKGESDALSFQVQDPGLLRWLTVQPRRGAFIVNTGDMLERLSNGRFKSNLHRVVVPE
eukprot:CAMPEP_0113662328 /NCGR_PEP_ID=MMETSP0038_2-20120614/508_1 /TAXON_ID=2898 /ORGANISM="Cryptomonas paramecium" /LENGTH=282 /DNA_ID=CAMNT_0000577197 /DNA_START=56 /DNA_END=901 /DNA_ORIENTATION=- /assembly_acc=CAM_ASM_000170